MRLKTVISWFLHYDMHYDFPYKTAEISTLRSMILAGFC